MRHGCSDDVPDSVERPVQQPEHLTKAHLLRCRNWWVSTFVGAGEPDRGKFHAQTWSHERRPVARRCKPVLLKKPTLRSEEHTSELQSLMRISYAVFLLKKKQHT